MSLSHIQFKHFDELIKKRVELSPYVSTIGLADVAVYNYVKEGGLFGKRQERSIFYFFQGLNTNPQNLSIFLRDQHQKENKHAKQKIVKGQFIIYDVFNKTDCVIEINIPGNFQIYKINNNKKELISNSQMEMMYVSSVLRSMHGKNMSWGRSFCLFKTKNMLQQFRDFLNVFIRVVQKNDFFISQDFQNNSQIKGSHSTSILFQFIKQKHIVHHAIQYLQTYRKQNSSKDLFYPKLAIFLAQLHNYDQKYSKSLSIVGDLLQKYTNDPFLVYYQARYMFNLLTVHQALTLVHSIIQYNQYEVWLLAAQIHTQLKNYSDALVCINHALKGCGKVSKNFPKRNIDVIYQEFQKIGKKKLNNGGDDITSRPKLINVSENPLSLAGQVQQKFSCMIQSQYWKLNQGQKKVYNLLRKIKSRIQPKKFHEILEATFQQNVKQYAPVVFKKGMTESMFMQVKSKGQQNCEIEQKTNTQLDQLPTFLQEQSMEIQTQQIIKNNRNLSIIPEIESVIQNSQFEQKQKESHSHKTVKTKKEMCEGFYKILKISLNENQFEKAEYEQNYAKILPIYNKLRSVSKYNNLYTYKMFEIMVKTGNFKSIVVLVAETLDLLEQTGVKKIQTLPFWMETYIYAIIQEKGLKFLNQLIQKLNFYDQALLDTIQMSKSWKIKGCTF